VQLIDVARTVTAGTATLVQLAVRGELRREHVWLGVRGAGRYARAVASGDVADDEGIDERLYGQRGCKNCPARTITSEGGYVASWCGTPLVEGRDDLGPTCGCLVEAKASVASEACPRGRWVASVLAGRQRGPTPTPPVGSP